MKYFTNQLSPSDPKTRKKFVGFRPKMALILKYTIL